MKYDVKIIDYEVSDWIDYPYCREAIVYAYVNGVQGSFMAQAVNMGGGDCELNYDDSDLADFVPLQDIPIQIRPPKPFICRKHLDPVEEKRLDKQNEAKHAYRMAIIEQEDTK